MCRKNPNRRARTHGQSNRRYTEALLEHAAKAIEGPVCAPSSTKSSGHTSFALKGLADDGKKKGLTSFYRDQPFEKVQQLERENDEA